MHAAAAPLLLSAFLFAEGVRVRIIIMLMLLCVALSAFLTISSVIPIRELSHSLAK
jgi:hypothetical protein